jgi:choline dehydrogenase-like flavoprotein
MSPNPLDAGLFRALSLICDALLPADQLAWRASVPARGAGVLARLPNPDDLAQLRWLLRLMEVPAVNLVLAGRRKRLSAMDRAEREAYLRALAHHPLSRIRGAFGALKRLSGTLYYADIDGKGQNPTWPAIGYPGPVAPPPRVAKPLSPLQVDRDVTLDCDVVMVGSGAGGGMAALELAAAGHEVIVVEKGGYFNEADFNGRELEMLQKLYLGGGLQTTRDQGMVVAAGSCLGGGTVVNYTTSFRTPGSIRQEWARSSRLDFFLRAEFDNSLDAACARFCVNMEHSRPSARDAIMARGLEACGWHVDAMPRNVVGCTQDDVCGYCGLGCVRGAKCSTLKTCLQGACERGARILVETGVQRVIVERGRATGVVARTASGHTVTVRARAVVVAGGAIESPALLLRSGLSPPVGENLRLHPATAVWGRFDEEVRPWTGTLQARYSDQFVDMDAGYGLKLETASVHPGLLASAGPWESAEQFGALMHDLSHLSLVGILLRDRDGGRITVSRKGLPLIRYRLSEYDRRHVRRGVEGAARVLLAAGAKELFSTQNRLVRFQRGNEPLEAWLARVDRAGYGSNQTFYYSFHQMGTCRMGADPRTSVVDGAGEAHAVKRLFVADASLFPSASGVNPMVTIAALAHYVAQQIKARL